MTSDSAKRTPVLPREYYGFKMRIDGVLTTVIARVEWQDEADSPWGHWFSKQAPDGAQRAIPVAALKRIDDAAGHNAINAIAAGMELPAELVAELPEIEGARWA